MSRYNSKSSNPFEDDDGDFVYVPNGSQNRGPFDDRRQQLSRLANESEDRQLESTQRAIASLFESEAMGNATAEELLRQREVIQNIEKKTDDINSTLTTSQRHINNIKSVFGGIKNWWGAKKDAPNPQAEQKRGSSLDNIVKRSQESGDGGAMAGNSSRPWASDSSRAGEGGLYSDGDLDSRFMANAPPSRNTGGAYGASYSQGPILHPVTGSAREQEIDKNLGMMSDGLSRLKDLARGLGDEIDMQNEDLDRITPKVNRANDLLENQNTQMNRILKR